VTSSCLTLAAAARVVVTADSTFASTVIRVMPKSMLATKPPPTARFCSYPLCEVAAARKIT